MPAFVDVVFIMWASLLFKSYLGQWHNSELCLTQRRSENNRNLIQTKKGPRLTRCQNSSRRKTGLGVWLSLWKDTSMMLRNELKSTPKINNVRSKRCGPSERCMNLLVIVNGC